MLKLSIDKTLLITSATSGVGMSVIDSLSWRRKTFNIIEVSAEHFGQLESEFDLVF